MELTQKVNLLKGIRVGEEVNVGFGVDVSVIVGVSVTVELAVGLTVDVWVSVVEMTTAVADGRVEGVGVEVGDTGGVRKKVDRRASRIRTPMMMGIAYLRSIIARVVVGTTGSPVYPKVVNRLFRLAA